MSTLAFDRYVSGSNWTFDYLVDVVGVPTITALSTVQDGAAITITGTSFSGSGNSVFALQGSKLLQLVVASEGTTSITTGNLDCSGLYLTQPLTVYVTNASAVASNVVTASIVPATGQAAFLVTQEFLGDASSRISAEPDLSFGDEVRLRNVSGGAITDLASTGQAAVNGVSTVTSFEAAAFDGTILGSWALQQRVAPVTTASVPNVIGETATAAQADIVAAGFVPVIVATIPNSTIASGSICAQFPSATTTLALGSVVELTVSQGIVQGLVPNMIGLPSADALAALTTVGLSGATSRVIDGNNSGNVLAQSQAPGTVVAPGTVIVLAVSSNLMPDVSGLLFAAASTTITGAGLTVADPVDTAYSSSDPGTVLRQSPAADAVVSPGDTVTLTISIGPYPDHIMLTTFLDDATAVPATATYVSGHAFAQDGSQYVALWPSSNAVFYDGPFAYRSDGALIIAIGGSPVVRPEGVALTGRGEVIAAVDTPVYTHNRWSMKSDGTVCMSDVGAGGGTAGTIWADIWQPIWAGIWA